MVDVLSKLQKTNKWIHEDEHLEDFFYLSDLISLPDQKRFWFIDEDVRFGFNPLVYECILEHYQIFLSSPGRLLAFACIWNLMNEKVSTGYILDLVCCQILNQIYFRNISSKQICSILDSFSIDHLSDGINTVDVGNQELSVYEDLYRNYKTKRQAIGPIVKDLSILYGCTNIYSYNQPIVL
ncbi:hypothetical protein I4U23_009639 [Adineta vaga]|nr:hypothetical protein I4U23_009639 [Adineta vaga]